MSIPSCVASYKSALASEFTRHKNALGTPTPASCLETYISQLNAEIDRHLAALDLLSKEEDIIAEMATHLANDNAIYQAYLTCSNGGTTATNYEIHTHLNTEASLKAACESCMEAA